ncbi:MAG: T9SS type A sorting domain-containing protein [Bacteroidetes bacterium]|nr:T9SS type A sorting domain-containing protein [Bacteroidota bacterium]
MKRKKLLFNILSIVGGVAFVILLTSAVGRHHDGITGAAAKKNGNDGIRSSESYYSLLRINQVTGLVNPSDVLRARQEVVKSIAASERGLGLTWEEAGPDNFAGRTRALLLDHRDATNKTLYAAGVAGGIWKSTTGGLTWHQLQTTDFDVAVSCMAQAPNGDIYVGTGEIFLAGGTYKLSQLPGFIGHGILKSTDGVSFTVISSTIPDVSVGNTADWAYVNELAVDPTNSRIYAATNTGLKYSNDGGQSWTLAKAATGENLDTLATDVSVAANGLVVASVQNWCYISASGDPNGFVSHSTRYSPAPDTVVNPDKLPMEEICRVEFAIAPSNNDVIYAVIARIDVSSTTNTNEFGQLEGIYKSEDKGLTWELIGPGGSNQFNVLGSFFVADGTNNYFYLGNYNNTIIVYPTDPDRIFVGGYDMWEGVQVNPTGYYQWNQKSNSDLQGWYTYIHSSHHRYLFDPSNPNICYVACDGGIYVTNDGFDSFVALNRNYNVNQFYSVSFDNAGHCLGGTQGNGILMLGSGNTPKNAEQLLTGNGGYNEISMIFPNCFILGREKVDIRRSDDRGYNFSPVFLINDIANPNAFITPYILWESFNNENTRDSVDFVAIRDYLAGDTLIARSYNAQYPFIYTTDVAIWKNQTVRIPDPVSARLFIAVEDVVWMTKEVLDFTKEPEWWEISNFDGIPQCIATSGDVNYVYVGTQNGKLYRIANVALAYNYDRADVNSPSCIVSTTLIRDFGNRVVTSVTVDPNDDNNIVVTLGNYGNTDYVYMSTNALDSIPGFSSMQGNLPEMPVYTSIFEMNGPDRIIIGTEYGIWTCTNPGSAQWTIENDGMDVVPVFMLKQQRLSAWPITNYGAIYAATFGRGIFTSSSFVGIDDHSAGKGDPVSVVSVFPNPVSSSALVKFNLDHAGPVKLDIYDLNSRIVKSLDMRVMNSGVQEIRMSSEDLQPGTYVITITCPNQKATGKFVVVR